MIKGLERKVVLLKNTNSRYFDEAYFIMKDDLTSFDDGEILREAERIMFSAEGCKRIKGTKKKRILKIALFTILGALLGFGMGLFWAFFI